MTISEKRFLNKDIETKNQANKLTDEVLIEKAKRDLSYFSEIVERYEKKLAVFIRRISYFGNEDIEDILQDVFVKVYKNLNSFDKSFKFSAWIYQIARNQTYDEIRKLKRRPGILSLEYKDLLKIIGSGQDVQRETEVKDNLGRIEKIMRELPYKYREVLVLRFVEEKTYDEIVDILKKPKGSIATLIRRGKKKLDSKLKEAKFI
ncbi:MAG: sigma-70 family RNA polymerase sigma factor [Candidatus Moranbacteria bacterium]|nr:sigma-70 family RNA polymerase sigma factor [Candidatus Moranbacteria bacterium]